MFLITVENLAIYITEYDTNYYIKNVGYETTTQEVVDVPCPTVLLKWAVVFHNKYVSYSQRNLSDMEGFSWKATTQRDYPTGENSMVELERVDLLHRFIFVSFITTFPLFWNKKVLVLCILIYQVYTESCFARNQSFKRVPQSS